MKTLLIIEMPDNYTLDNYYAEVVVKRKKNNNKIKAFPHVSLKPSPQHKLIDLEKTTDYSCGWEQGYNTCIDEILEGEQE